MESKFNEYRRYYVKSFVTPSQEMRDELIGSPVPEESDVYKNCAIRGYVLLSNCKLNEISHLRILTSYEKLLKKNQEEGMKTTSKEFALILYILHRYCVRLLRNPWREEFRIIKTYNGFYQYTLASLLAPRVIEDLLQFMGFEYDDLGHIFVLKWSNSDTATTRLITNAGIGFFLSYIYCRARHEPEFKDKVKSLAYLLQEPSPRDEPRPSSSHRRNLEREHHGSGRNGSQQRRSRNHGYTSHQTSPRSTGPHSIAGSRTDIYESAMPYPQSTKKSRDIYNDQQSSYFEEDLYGAASIMSRSRDSKREVAAESRARSALHASHPSLVMNSRTKNFRMNESSSLLVGPKDYSDNYAQFFMGKSSARGSPDGGTDQDFKERTSSRHSEHIYQHIE